MAVSDNDHEVKDDYESYSNIPFLRLRLHEIGAARFHFRQIHSGTDLL